MSLPTVTGVGRLIDAPELRFSASGGAVLKVRLAFNSRKRDESGQWVDDASFFVTGTLFGRAAENAAESLDRAMEVVVTGRLKTESWETRDGEKRSGPSLLIDSIGPSLRYATAKVTKASGGGKAEYQQARQAQGQSSAGDPWASSQSSAAPAGGGWGQGGGGYSGEEPPF
jgi:single-strand DNA-binding protein